MSWCEFDAYATRQSSRTYLVVLDREEDESVGVDLENGLVHLVALDAGSCTRLCFFDLGKILGHRNALDRDSNLFCNDVFLLF
jgi:hypothetical protein